MAEGLSFIGRVSPCRRTRVMCSCGVARSQDREASPPDQPPTLRVRHQRSARRQHAAVRFSEMFGQSGLLQPPVILFAVQREDFTERDPRALFNHCIELDKLHLEPPRKLRPHGGFARAAQSGPTR